MLVPILDGALIEDAPAVADRIQRVFADAMALRTDLSIHPTLSVEVACAPSAGAPLDVLMPKADAALYRSKRDGRNKVAVGDVYQLAVQRRRRPPPEPQARCHGALRNFPGPCVF